MSWTMIENAPVLTFQHRGLTIEGYSRAAVQTYWRIPELKLGFDLGLQPWSFMGTPNWFVTHMHLDHIVALPVYVARRRMMKMEPPAIYVPRYAVPYLERILKLWQRLDRGRMECQLIGVGPGNEIELSRDHVVSVFPTRHSVPSVGYLVWERRKKLKPEYHGLPGHEIRDLRLSGTEVTYEVRLPLVAYLGDTAPEGLDATPDVYKAYILIAEVTYLSAKHKKDKIHKFGHIHLDDIIERADRFENEVIVFSHVSARYNKDRVEKILRKRLPKQLRSRVKVWM